MAGSYDERIFLELKKLNETSTNIYNVLVTLTDAHVIHFKQWSDKNG